MPSDAQPSSASELLEHAAFLRGLATALVGAHEAPDLVQDALARALEHPPRERRSLRGWLAVVLGNLARNTGRGAAHRAERERASARPEGIEPDQLALERLEVQRLLVELLLALPSEQRTVLHLRYFEDLTPSAIAAHLGVPLKTVKSRHTRALAALRERLDRRSNGDRNAWMAALAPFVLPKSGIVTTLAGGLAMKKLVLVAAVLVLAFGAWRGAAGAWRQRLAASHGSHRIDETPLVTPPAELAPALAAEVLGTRQALQDEPPPATGALRLVFTHSDGSPAADAPLTIECRADPAPRVEVRQVRTDAQGHAEVAELFAGEAWLWLADQRFEAEVAADEVRAFEFRLAEGFVVVGTVQDEQGTPVAGAEIWGGHSGSRQPGGYLLTRCDSSGRFRARDLYAFAPLCARKAGYVASTAQVPMDLSGNGSGERVATLVLVDGGGRVRGRVFDPAGRPLEGASVLAGPDGGWTIPNQTGRTPEVAFAETDANGDFVLGCNLQAGKHPLHATARGFHVWRGEVEVTEGGTSALEIRLEEAARVEGRLLGVDGAPAAGVLVLASEEDRGGWYHDRFGPPEAVTDAEGWFALDGLAPGTRELNASDDERPEIGRARASVVCTAGATSTCELRLELGHTIAGRVVGGDGAPLRGWSVHSQASFFRQWYPRRATTDAQGRFLLANLGEGSHELTVRAPGLDGFPRARLADVPVGSTDIELVVADAELRPGRLRGRLVTPRGSSPWDFTVTLWAEGAKEGHYLDLDGSTGAFELEAQPGRYFAKASAGGVEKLASETIALEEGGVADFGDLVLEGGGWIEIEVSGLPQAQLERLKFHLDRPGANTVDLAWEDGLLRSPEALPGRWKVTWNEDELLAREDEVVIVVGETRRATLTLEPAIPIEVRPTPAPSGEITFQVFDADGRLLSERRYLAGSSEGTYGLGLRPGRQRITAQADRRRGELTLDVTPGMAGGEPLTLELR